MGCAVMRVVGMSEVCWDESGAGAKKDRCRGEGVVCAGKEE